MEIRVRELEIEDLDRGFLETLDNLRKPELKPEQYIPSVEKAREIFEEMRKMNEAIKKNEGFGIYNVFVAETEEDKQKKIVGATTLFCESCFPFDFPVFLEQKFIRLGGTVARVCLSDEKEEMIRKSVIQARGASCYKALAYCKGENNIRTHELAGFRNAEVVMSQQLNFPDKFGWWNGHIEDVATRKGYEGKGVAKVVLLAAIERAKKIGCCELMLTCKEELVPFYERFGFKTAGRCMRVDL